MATRHRAPSAFRARAIMALLLVGAGVLVADPSSMPHGTPSRQARRPDAPHMPVPGLPVPGLPVPGLPVPGLPVPGLPVPGLPAFRMPTPRVPEPRVPAPEPPRDLAARLRAHVAALADAGGHRSRVVFTPGNAWSVEYVLGQMRRHTRDVRADTFMVGRRSARGEHALVNPVALLPGRSDSVIVVCAHIDASASRDRGWRADWSRMPAPGANDNATGIAAMLETLALAANAPERPRYTLMFVGCNAEERNPDYAGLSRRDGHHLGSRQLASSLKKSGARVRGVIAMDMVGWNPRADYMPLFSTGRSRWLARELAAHREWMELDLALAANAGPCDNSDNESFDRFGIPAVLLMESCAPWRADGRHPRNPAYHTGRDVPAAVTYSILVKVTRLVAAYAMR